MAGKVAETALSKQINKQKKKENVHNLVVPNRLFC